MIAYFCDGIKVTDTCLWYVTNLPLLLLQKPVLRVPTHTSDRMSQWFPIRERGSVLYLGMATEILNLP